MKTIWYVRIEHVADHSSTLYRLFGSIFNSGSGQFNQKNDSWVVYIMH